MNDATWKKAPPRFTRYELACLLAGQDTPSVNRSRELLNIPTVSGADDLVFRAGRASLAARGYFAADGPVAVPRNEAGAVAYALAHADQWLSLLGKSGERMDTAVLILGERMSVLGRIAPADGIDFVPVPPTAPAPVMVRRLAEGMLGMHDDSAILLKRAGLSSLSTAFIRRDGEQWGVARDVVLPDDSRWPAADATLQPMTKDAALDEVFGAVAA